jgi:hypothetical protein
MNNHHTPESAGTIRQRLHGIVDTALGDLDADIRPGAPATREELDAMKAVALTMADSLNIDEAAKAADTRVINEAFEGPGLMPSDKVSSAILTTTQNEAVTAGTNDGRPVTSNGGSEADTARRNLRNGIAQLQRRTQAINANQ